MAESEVVLLVLAKLSGLQLRLPLPLSTTSPLIRIVRIVVIALIVWSGLFSECRIYWKNNDNENSSGIANDVYSQKSIQKCPVNTTPEYVIHF